MTISNDLGPNDSLNGHTYNQKPSIEEATTPYDDTDGVRMTEINNEKVQVY